MTTRRFFVTFAVIAFIYAIFSSVTKQIFYWHIFVIAGIAYSFAVIEKKQDEA